MCITSAKHSQGISKLISQIFEFQSSHRQDILEKDRSFKTQLTLRLVQEKITGAIAQEPELRRLLEGMGKDNPFAAAEAIYRRLISGGDDD